MRAPRGPQAPCALLLLVISVAHRAGDLAAMQGSQLSVRTSFKQ